MNKENASKLWKIIQEAGDYLAGQNGSDIRLSKVARKLVGVNFECKNQNKMKTIYNWYKQSSKNSNRLMPCVVMKMNTRQPLVVIDLDDFMDLIK